MIRRRILASAAALSLTALAGCETPPPQVVVLSPAAGCDTRFQVVNASAGTVERLFFSHSNLNAWGADQLGQNVLPPGRVVSYRAANPGNYDFRVVWTNGAAAELRRVNICAASTITVRNGRLTAS